MKEVLFVLWLITGSANLHISKETVFAFGDRNVQLEMIAGNPQAEICADLFQAGGRSIIAPLQKDILVTDKVQPDGRIIWKLPLPEVEKETHYVAKLRARDAGDAWVNAGQIEFFVYPENYTQASLKALGKAVPLRLFGESKVLRAYLKAQKISFEETDNELSELRPQSANDGEPVLYLGEATAEEFAKWRRENPAWNAPIAVFCPDPKSRTLPGIWISGCVAKVTVPLVEKLNTDPRSRLTLLEILQTIQNL